MDEPLPDECPYRKLLQALGEQRKFQTAQAAYDGLCRCLKRIGRSPEADTTRLAAGIRDEAGRFLRGAGDGRIPSAITAFVGRATEVAKVRRLLGRSRLVTLTGPGGIGKSRLAFEVGRQLREAFFDRVWFAELATLASPGLVPRRAGRPMPDIEALHLAGAWIRRGEGERARALLLPIATKDDSHCGYVAQACWLLSRLALREGDVEAARRYEEKALRLALEAREPIRIHVLSCLGHAVRELGEIDQARAFYNHNLELRDVVLSRNLNDRHAIPWWLQDHAVLAALSGEHARAVRLFGASERQAEGLGQAMPVVLDEGFDQAVALSKAALGEESFDAAWNAGRARTCSDNLGAHPAPVGRLSGRRRAVRAEHRGPGPGAYLSTRPLSQESRWLRRSQALGAWAAPPAPFTCCSPWPATILVEYGRGRPGETPAEGVIR